MGDDTLSRKAYTRATRSMPSSGPTTARAEQTYRSTGRIDPLVDPSGGGKYGPVRESRSRKNPDPNNPGMFRLLKPAIKLEHLYDTTTSMGDSTDKIVRGIGKFYELLTTGEHPALGMYDPQIISAPFGDVDDPIVLMRSQAEMAEKIVEQLAMMVPVRSGGDVTEDPQYGILAAAAFSRTSNWHEYGVKGYHFLSTDAPGRSSLTESTIARVFGSEWKQAMETNGNTFNTAWLGTEYVIQQLMKTDHAFLLAVRGPADRTWVDWYGSDRVIRVDDVDRLSVIQAAIIALTEGVVTLADLPGWIQEYAQMSSSDARAIAGSMSHIPIGAQRKIPGFKLLPKAGDVFEKKEDIWPIGHPNYKGDKKLSDLKSGPPVRKWKL